MQNTNSSVQKQRPKRLMLAEQIRRRDRHQKLNQIRVEHGIRQKTWQILKSEQIKVEQLCELIRQKPSNQAGVSSAVAQWLRQEKRNLCMRSVNQLTGWAQILCCVVEYDCNMVAVVVEYLKVLAECGQRIGQMEQVFLLMCAIMNIIQFPARYPQSTQFNVKQGFRQYANELLVYALSMYHLFKIGSNQLRFYTRFLRIYPNQSDLVASNSNFLSRICNYLGAQLDQKKNISQIFKILALLTYYDGQHYEGVTDQLINYGCLSHILFFIEFTRQPDWTDAVCQALSVIDNMILNVGVASLLDTGLMPCLNNMIEEPNQVPGKLLQACIQTYLSIVEHCENKTEQLEYLREQNVMDEIFSILEKYGPHRKQVEQNCYYALIRLLNIGQQMRQCKQAQINPYLLKLKYYNIVQIFSQFPIFDGLLAKYGIES